MVEAGAAKANDSAAPGATGKAGAGAKAAEEVGSSVVLCNFARLNYTLGVRVVLGPHGNKWRCCNQPPMCRRTGSGGALQSWG